MDHYFLRKFHLKHINPALIPFADSLLKSYVEKMPLFKNPELQDEHLFHFFCFPALCGTAKYFCIYGENVTNYLYKQLMDIIKIDKRLFSIYTELLSQFPHDLAQEIALTTIRQEYDTKEYEN